MSAGQVMTHVAAWLEDVLGLLDEPLVMEAGCGGGQYARFVRRGWYVSFDIPQTWYDMERLPTVHASADAIPFGSGVFDLAFCVSAFDYFPRPQQVMSEVARCLKPGGCFLVFTYDEPTLRMIHEKCAALPPGPATAGHHVYDAATLMAYGAAAGLAGGRLLYLPRMGLLLRLKLLLRPTNLRVFRFTKPRVA